ncbi:MAG: hypothetical protein HOD92_08080 [Deltaproteobacteria bacterium]|jgi:hypothetical protein|nr:hypothetical protein [Deltaproteobacteria bacterium]
MEGNMNTGNKDLKTNGDHILNNSGMGEDFVPDGVKGWSFGAFFLNWIWAIMNNTWIGLLCLIPFIGFVMAIILGIKGREWAWKNRRWQNFQHFDRVQKRWSFWGVTLLVLVPVLGLLAALMIPTLSSFLVK